MNNQKNGIKLYNKNWCRTYLRVNSYGLGWEDWDLISPDYERFYEREPGSYLIEITEDRYEPNSTRWISWVTSPCDITVHMSGMISYQERKKDEYESQYIAQAPLGDYHKWTPTRELFKDVKDEDVIKPIEIENRFMKKHIFVHISGYGGGSEDWIVVWPGTKEIINRNCRYINFLEYSMMPINNSGNVVGIRGGDSIYIDDKFDCFNSKDNERFWIDQRSFRSVQHNLVYIGEGMCKTPAKSFSDFKVYVESYEKYLIINATEKEIKVRLESQYKYKGELNFTIPPMTPYAWKKEKFDHLLSEYLVDIHYENQIYRYQTEINGIIFHPTKYLTNSMRQLVHIAKIKFNGSEDPEYLLKVNDPYYVSKKEQKIEFKNEYDKKIYIRVKARSIGSEDLFGVESGQKIKFSREFGEYVAEIIIDKNTRFKFLVSSMKNYTFDSYKELFDNETNQKSNLTQTGSFLPCEFDEPVIPIPEPIIEPVIPIPEPIIEPVIPIPEPIIEPVIPIPEPIIEPVIPIPEPIIEPVIPIPEPIIEPVIPIPQPLDDLYKDAEYYMGIKPNLDKVKHDKSFIDQEFPPEKRIINSLDNLGVKKSPHFFHCKDTLDDYWIEFKRPVEVYGEYNLFNDIIDVEDVKQGEIGDCYFISTISCIAKYPEILQKIFKTKSKNKDGLYELVFYYQKKKTIVYVDDYLPYDTYYKSWKYANPKNNQIWPLILEKAFAKFEGGYSNIIGGNACWLFEFFTGKASKYIHNYQVESCWEQIVNSTKKYSLLYAGSNSPPGTTDQNMSARNICYGHAYSVLDAKEFNNGNLRLRMLQLRNPWGCKEWNGDYSDNSPLWTPELIDYFHAKDVMKEDGRFWMKIEDFKDEFDKLIICEFDDIWS